MDEKLLKLKFEAEQRRSREIDKKLKATEKDRIPAEKPAVVEPTVVAPAPVAEVKEEAVSPIVAPPVQGVRTAPAWARLTRLGGSSLRDAIVLSEIISKPVSKRR